MCNKNDFTRDKENITLSHKMFYPLINGKETELEMILGKSLLCIDEDVSLKGDWQSGVAKVLIASFEKCDRKARKTCRSDQEVNEWLKDKYMYVVFNEVILDQYGFRGKKFQYNSLIDFIPIGSNTKVFQSYNVKTTQLTSQEDYFPRGAKINEFSNLVVRESFSYSEFD